MADLNSDRVRVAQTGRLFYSDPAAAAALPATWVAGGAWPAAWKSLGLFDEDAVEHSFSDDTDEITSWQRGVVRIIVKGRELTLKLSALETSVEVLEMFYGATFALQPGNTSAKLSISASAARKPVTLGFEWEDSSSGALWRLYVPRATVSDSDSPKFAGGDAVKWGVTLRALGSDAPSLAEWTTNDPQVLTSLGAPAS